MPAPEQPSPESLLDLWERTVLSDGRGEAADPSASYRATAMISEATLRVESAPSSDGSPPDFTRLSAMGAAKAESAASGYEFIEEIGRGGMGIVYRARQRSLDRDVAVKLLQARRDADAAARFVNEAVITGALDHPNIVPVHELGTSPSGDVYLAMKLVGGVTWKQLLHPESPGEASRAKGYDVDRHLAVLERTAFAAAFAHSRGVIHRDLKPSNVMVGDFDEVLLMDWGLATRYPIDETGEAAPCGTPVYMPPELARGDVRSMSPATDVYLLGAVLYEILTGKPPHRRGKLSETLAAAATSLPPEFPAEVPEELAAICRRAMAARPIDRFPSAAEFIAALRDYGKHRESLKITDDAERRLDASSSTGRAGHADDRHTVFAGAVAGFEQALLLWPGNERATRRLEETRREWATFALSSGDFHLARAQIDRIGTDDHAARLRRELIAAESARTAADARIRRLRRTAVAATILLLASMATGLVLVKLESRKTAAALLAEQRERDRAQRRFDDTRRLANALIFEVHDAVEKLPGATAARKLVVDRSIEFLDRLAQESRGDRSLEYELAQGYDRVAGVEGQSLAGNVGNTEAAMASIRRALELREGLVRSDPSDADAARAVWFTRRMLSDLLVRAGRLDEGATELDVAEHGFSELLVRLPRHPWLRRDIAGVHQRRGFIEAVRARPEEAIAHFEKAAAMARILVDEKPTDRDARSDLMGVLGDIAEARQRLGETEKACVVFAEADAIGEALVLEAPGDADLLRRVIVIVEDHANSLRIAGRLEDARSKLERALAVRRRIAGLDATNLQARSEVGSALLPLGDVEQALGNSEKSLALFIEWRSIADEVHELDPSNDVVRRDVVLSNQRAGDLLLATGRLAEARTAFERAREVAYRTVDVDPSSLRAIIDAAGCDFRVSDVFRDEGRYDEAEEILLASIAMTDRPGEAAKSDVQFQRIRTTLRQRLAAILGKAQRPAEALAWLERGIEIQSKLADADPENVEVARDLMVFEVYAADSALALGSLDQAKTAADHAITIGEKLHAKNPNAATALDLAGVLRMAADVERRRNDDTTADRLAARIVDSLVPLAEREDVDPLVLYELAATLHRRATHRLTNDIDGAESDASASIACFERLLERMPEHNETHSGFSMALQTGADVALARGDTANAHLRRKKSHERLAHLADRPDATASTLNDAAWHFVTDLPESTRDLARGLAYARLAVERSARRDPAILDTLAAALFANGDARQALEVEIEALSLATPDGPFASLRAEIEANIARYRAATE